MHSLHSSTRIQTQASSWQRIDRHTDTHVIPLSIVIHLKLFYSKYKMRPSIYRFSMVWRARREEQNPSFLRSPYVQCNISYLWMLPFQWAFRSPSGRGVFVRASGLMAMHGWHSVRCTSSVCFWYTRDRMGWMENGMHTLFKDSAPTHASMHSLYARFLRWSVGRPLLLLSRFGTILVYP